MRGSSIIRPGYFSVRGTADQMRPVYDRYNEQIIHNRLPINFVFIGESITQFWDVQTYFGGRKNTIVNRGISGDMTFFMLKRFPADVLQLKPKYVHIMGGTNNTWRMGAFDPQERKSPNQIYFETVSDIGTMVREAKKYGIIPIIGSNLPTGKGIPCFESQPLLYCRDTSTDLRNELLFQINHGTRQLAVYETAIYVDYHSYMTDRDGRTLRPELADDGLHPNVLGYNIMAEVLYKTLAAAGVEIGTL
ncbi:GDSL-type esterase/lipase family protein [Paenibacillus solisilvae]|uniref:GDSL-type esterase/lipase family protein n=1 Tax=Paenibacillus solisilvae TaxID=2486751 RepID=A0ABW0W7I0_9BACL